MCCNATLLKFNFVPWEQIVSALSLKGGESQTRGRPKEGVPMSRITSSLAFAAIFIALGTQSAVAALSALIPHGIVASSICT
jgi:hypothetical protein